MRLTLPAASLFGLLASLTAGESNDQSLLDLPGAVKLAIQHEAAGHGIAALEHGFSEGHSLYHVRIVQEGFDKRMTVAIDGTVISVSDFAAVNNALASGTQADKQAWDKTKEVAVSSWEATRDTVRKAVDAFRSDELTLNQVPPAPRATLERAAAGNRITDIHATSDARGTTYHANIRAPDGPVRPITVGEDGTLVTTGP